MKILKKVLFLFVFIFQSMGLISQVKEGAVFKEYIWTTPNNENFLRVGGKLHYGNHNEAYPKNLVDGEKILLPQDVDLKKALKAEVTLEWIQSHEDTKGLNISFNGNEGIPVNFPEYLGDSAKNYMFHVYPTLDVPLEHLKKGLNNYFAMSVNPTQRWGWPQNIFYAITLRIYYNDKVVKDRLIVEPKLENGKIQLSVNGDKSNVSNIDFIGQYQDYDYDSDGQYYDWQFSTFRGVIRNHIGSSTEGKFTWNTENITDQDNKVKVTALVSLNNGLKYYTSTATINEMPERDYNLKLITPEYSPENWVTRAGEFGTEFVISEERESVLGFQLMWTSWSPCYMNGLSMNGRLLMLREGPCYDYFQHFYDNDDSSMLKQGKNELKTGLTPFYDGGMVHGMEVQWPGIMMKLKTEK